MRDDYVSTNYPAVEQKARVCLRLTLWYFLYKNKPHEPDDPLNQSPVPLSVSVRRVLVFPWILQLDQVLVM
jgi:hypothetical protein